MRNTTSAILIVVGLGILWLAVNGKLDNLQAGWTALVHGGPKSSPSGGWGGGASGKISTPATGSQIPWPLSL